MLHTTLTKFKHPDFFPVSGQVWVRKCDLCDHFTVTLTLGSSSDASSFPLLCSSLPFVHSPTFNDGLQPAMLTPAHSHGLQRATPGHNPQAPNKVDTTHSLLSTLPLNQHLSQFRPPLDLHCPSPAQGFPITAFTWITAPGPTTCPDGGTGAEWVHFIPSEASRTPGVHQALNSTH